MDQRFFNSVFILALFFGLLLSFKGFAGFDLSPMISATSSIHLGGGINDFQSNPISPGFLAIVSIFTLIAKGTYTSYFIGNIIYCAILFFIGSAIIRKTFFNRKNKDLEFILNLQLIFIFLPNLLSDGHFYISDTSNILCVFNLLLLEVIFVRSILVENEENRSSFNLMDFCFACLTAFILYLKPNVAIPTFLLSLATYPLLMFLTLPSGKAIKKSLILFACIILFFFVINFSLEHFINFDLHKYIQILIDVNKERGLDFNNTSINTFGKRFISLSDGRYYVNFCNFFLIFVFFLMAFFKFNITKKYLLIAFISFILFYIYRQNDLFVPIIFVSLFLCLFTYLSFQRRRIFHFEQLLFVFAISALVIGFISMATNYDAKSSDYSFLFFGIFLLSHTIYVHFNLSFSRLKNLLILLSIFFTLQFTAEGALRYKLLLAGFPADYSDFRSTLSDGYFLNLKTSKLHLEQMSSIDNAMVKYKGLYSQREVLFGPRLEYLYEKYKLLPPIGMPLWWHIHTSYQDKDIKKIKNNILNNGIKLMVFQEYEGKIDGGLMDDEMRKFLDSGYGYFVDRSFPHILVYVMR